MTDIERRMPPLNADERATLEAWLDFYRSTLAMKCGGLDDDALRNASVPLDDASPFMGAEVSLRWKNLHMIGEYARHCGQADLLRERIDGVTGV